MRKRIALLCALAACNSAPSTRTESSVQPPNIVFVLTDDQGYGDATSHGHPSLRTPHIDSLARDGMRFTQFATAACVCTPSRAAFLTGCYAKRLGLHERVIFPQTPYGMHPEETTLAELLRARGYATGCFGKWHLGHRAETLPTAQGFDRWFGIPYSNDMSQFHRKPGSRYKFRLPLMRGDADGCEVLEWEAEQRLFTRRFTDAAIDFVREHARARRPFFAYVPHAMPHIPLYASDAHRDTSRRGRYGDVIEEIDANLGRLLDALREEGVARDTIVVFSSDNGPWKVMGRAGGSAGPFRGGKGSNFEGGHRVPFLVRWPARIRAGSTCLAPSSALDLMPTLAGLSGEALGHAVDGRDLSALWLGAADDVAEPYELLYYSRTGALGAFRAGPWKLHLPTGEGQARLYQVERDISESRDLAGRERARVAAMLSRARELDRGIEAGARPRHAGGTRVFDPERPE